MKNSEMVILFIRQGIQFLGVEEQTNDSEHQFIKLYIFPVYKSAFRPIKFNKLTVYVSNQNCFIPLFSVTT